VMGSAPLNKMKQSVTAVSRKSWHLLVNIIRHRKQLWCHFQGYFEW
jgi:hypothetical protein